MVVDDRLLPPNVSDYYGIETINGYDPLIYAPYEKLFADSEQREFNRIIVAKNITSPIVAQLNVQYILSLDELNSPLATKLMEEGQTKLYKYLSGRPRVYFDPFNPLEPQPRITRYAEDRLTLEYESDEARSVIISQIAYPGWRAELDGKPIQLVTQNGILLGIDAPAGKHKVKLTYN